MRRVVALLLAVMTWPAIAWAQIAGAGYVDPLSICQGYMFTYNATTGTCVRTLNGAVNGTCSSMSSAFVANGTTTQNNAGALAFAKQAQYHTRPAVAGWYNGGYTNTSAVGNSTAGDGLQASDASPNNCITLIFPAGLFNYTTNNFTLNIPWLRILGAGGLSQASAGQTQLENSDNSGSDANDRHLTTNFDYDSDTYVGSPSNLGYFIQSISAGATSATLSGSAANAASFYPGGWILIASYDQQFGGYPPNFRYYDYAKLISANSSTGVLTWDTPTRFAHAGLPSGFTSSSVTNPYCTTESGCANPSTLTDGPAGTIGPARIIPLDTPSHPVSRWFEIDAINFLANPNWNTGTEGDIDSQCVQYSGIIDGLASDGVLDSDGVCFAMVRNFTQSSSRWNAIQADKTVNWLAFDSDIITWYDTSHASELQYVVNGGRIGNGKGNINGNYFNGLNGTWNNVVLDAIQGTCANFVAGIGVNNLNLFPINSVTVNNSQFYGNGCANNAPLNVGNLTTVTMDGTTNIIQTGPNGANTRLRIPASGAIGGSLLAGEWGIGNAVTVGGTLVAGTDITNISFDGTYVYVDVSGTTFSTGNVVGAALANMITVNNTMGNNTSFTWGSSPTAISYAGAHSVPTITWTNNSGN